MAQMNQVLLRGNLTRDPEKRFLPSGTSVVNFGLAVNRRYRSGEEWKEDTCFVDIVVFGAQGDWTMENCTKGSPVLVDGRLSFNTWEAQDGTGTRRSKHEVVAFNVHFIARRDEGGQGVSGRAQAQGAGSSWSGPPAGPQGGPGEPPPMTDDDIPF
ncbi:MAG: single-stranded DNA-binding protein [Nitrospinota bacterium]|nr:single-stranded DNA-binding protein [Nitrospinota bacterium]MDP6364899.1 single-stranded DNA-binding protein [Nitrospinota bacterium]